MATIEAILSPARTTIAPALKARLSTPEKTPSELASNLEKQSARTSYLREAHVEATRRRAAREVERVAEVEARRRRLAASAVDKVLDKLKYDATKISFKMEAKEAKRQAEIAHRGEQAINVANKRAAAERKLEARAATLREAEERAAAKHAKAVQAVHDKSASEVRHAAAVVQALEEKGRLEAEEASKRLTGRLEAAESRRVASSPSFSSRPVLGRVLNDQKVALEAKAKACAAKMDLATSRRAEYLESVVNKASSVTVRAAEKAAAAQKMSSGTDSASLATKAAHYEKLISAEISRSFQQKDKLRKFRGDTTSLIIVRIEKEHPTLPPPGLVKRLSTVGTSLICTATARQLGAHARRQATRSQLMLRSATCNAKRAAVLGRFMSKRASLAAATKAKAARALCNKAIQDGRKAHVVEKEHQRIKMAATARKAAATQRAAKGTQDAGRCMAAAESYDAKLRKIAKKGVSAIRLSANKSRRSAIMAKLVARSDELIHRFDKVLATKERLLAERIAKARRCQKAVGSGTAVPADAGSAEQPKTIE